jgi:hypothetical protein
MMDIYDAADILRRYWLEKADAPASHEIAAASCPFCGKGDRIRLLPPLLCDACPSSVPDVTAAWNLLASEDRLPALCGFCQNIVLVSGSRAEMPAE